MIDVLWLSHVDSGQSSRCLGMHHDAQGERTRNHRAVIQASDVALMDAAPLMRLRFLLLRDSWRNFARTCRSDAKLMIALQALSRVCISAIALRSWYAQRQ